MKSLFFHYRSRLIALAIDKNRKSHKYVDRLLLQKKCYYTEHDLEDFDFAFHLMPGYSVQEIHL